jgi:hypothetical protein
MPNVVLCRFLPWQCLISLIEIEAYCRYEPLYGWAQPLLFSAAKCYSIKS